jgi:transcriptional regulator with XRE-family HTH domain
MVDLREFGPSGPMNTEKAAKAARISRKQLWQLERGDIHDPHTQTLKGLAKAYQVPCATILAACRESYRRAHAEAGQSGGPIGSHGNGTTAVEPR